MNFKSLNHAIEQRGVTDYMLFHSDRGSMTCPPGSVMKGRKTSVESIIKIRREMEILQGQVSSIDAACKKLGISSQSFYS